MGFWLIQRMVLSEPAKRQGGGDDVLWRRTVDPAEWLRLVEEATGREGAARIAFQPATGTRARNSKRRRGSGATERAGG